MKLTVPQIIMLNAGASVNHEREESRRKTPKPRHPFELPKEMQRNNGKKPDEMTSDELQFGLMSFLRTTPDEEE